MDGVHVSPRGLPYSLDVAMRLIFMPSRGGGVGGLGQFLVTQSQARPRRHPLCDSRPVSVPGGVWGGMEQQAAQKPSAPQSQKRGSSETFHLPLLPKEVPAPRVGRWPRRARLCPDMIDSSSRCVSGAGRRWEAAGSPAVCSRSPVLKALRI